MPEKGKKFLELKPAERIKLALFIAGTTAVVYLSFRYLLPIGLPFLFAYFISKLLLPIVRFMKEKIRIPKTVGSIITLLVIFSIFVVVCCFLGKILFEQIKLFFRNFPIYQSYIQRCLNGFCGQCDKILGFTDGTAKIFVDNNMAQMLHTVQTRIVPVMTKHTITLTVGMVQVIGILFIVVMAILLIVKDNQEIKKNYENMVFYQDIHAVAGKLADAGIAYLKAQFILMLIIAFICSVALFLIRNRFALLIGIGIGIFDAFPVLGSGLILIPWAIVRLLSGDFLTAAVLISLYFICEMVREFLEPRLVGNKIGLKPIYTLMAMYTGIQLFGVAGFFLGPIGLVLIKTIVNLYLDKSCVLT